MTLEKLLNTLIQRGWYPFGRKYNSETGGDHNTISFNYYNNIDEERGLSNYSIRELVSKESGLWQFVCENKMVKKLGDNFKYFYNSRDNLSTLRYYEDKYKYWLLESALKDESELEEFLLNSIIIDD